MDRSLFPFHLDEYQQKKKGSSQTLVANAGWKNDLWRGWEYYMDDQNRINLRLINVAPSNLIHVRSLDSLQLNTWQHLVVTVDGSGKTEGVRFYQNGKEIETIGVIDNLYKTIKPTYRDKEKGFVSSKKRNLIIGKSYEGSTGDFGLFSGKLDEFKFFNGVLTTFEVESEYSETTGQKEEIAWTTVQKHLIEKDPQILELKKQLKKIVRNT